MTLIISIIFAVIGSIVTVVVLAKILKRIDPISIVDYVECKGNFREAYLNSCQTGLLKVPQQPINTYSNILYLTGGMFLMFEITSLPTYVFFITTLYLFIGSSWFHATSSKSAGHLDVSAMYALFTAMLVYSITSLTTLNDSIIALLMFIIAVLSAYLLIRRFYKYIIPILVLLTYMFVIINKLQNNVPQVIDGFIISSFVLFLLGIGAWLVDKSKFFPNNRWGHAFWHLFSAVAICLLYYSIYSLPNKL